MKKSHGTFDNKSTGKDNKSDYAAQSNENLSVINLSRGDVSVVNRTGIDASAFVGGNKKGNSALKIESSDSEESEDDVDANKKDIVGDVKDNYMF